MSPEREERLGDLEARASALEAAIAVLLEHMSTCPERGGPLSWRCMGAGRIVGHGKRCTGGRRL